MNHDEFRAETQNVRSRLRQIFNAFVRVSDTGGAQVAKRPKLMFWLIVLLFLIVALIEVKAHACTPQPCLMVTWSPPTQNADNSAFNP